jgi:hypothetical protein
LGQHQTKLYTDFNIASANALQSTSSLVTTEIAPNSEETPVVQILNPHNSDNDVQLVEPVTETPIQHAQKQKTSQFLGQHQTKLYMEVDL